VKEHFLTDFVFARMIRAQPTQAGTRAGHLSPAPVHDGANDRKDSYHRTIQRHSAWPVHSHTEKENEMSHANLSRRAIVAGAASVPALALPVAAGAIPATDPGLIALGERLKVMMPRVTALGLKSSALREEALSELPQGWGSNKQIFALYKEKRTKNGGDRAYEEWNAASSELNDLAETILEIPSNDRVGDGIRAAASAGARSRSRGRIQHGRHTLGNGRTRRLHSSRRR
jgi:hypothetical protein